MTLWSLDNFTIHDGDVTARRGRDESLAFLRSSIASTDTSISSSSIRIRIRQSVSQLIKLDDVRRQRRLPEQSCGAAGAVLASGHYWPVMTSHTDDNTHQLNDVCPSVRLSQRVSLQDTIEHRLPYHLPRRRHDYHKLIGLYVRHLPYRYKRFTPTPEVSPAILGLNWQAVGMCVCVCVMLPGVSFLRLNRQDTVGFGWPVTTHSSSALLPIEYCNSVGVSANFMSSIWYHNTSHITDTLTSQLKWR